MNTAHAAVDLTTKRIYFVVGNPVVGVGGDASLNTKLGNDIVAFTLD